MLRQKTYILIILTAIVAMSGTVAWLYFFDDIPKKTLPRARQVLLLDLSINRFEPVQTIIKH